MWNQVKRLIQRKYGIIIFILVLFLSIGVILEYNIHLLHEEEEGKSISPPIKIPPTPPNPVVTPQRSESPLPNPKQHSKYAYITLLSGLNPDFTHRGYLYNALIMQKSLSKLGSVADFIVMIGYQNDPSKGNIPPEFYSHDLNLLKRAGIIIYELPRYLSSNKYKLSFAEMALLKVVPFLLIQYEKIQYFDGDILPTKNMDCFFQLPHYTYTIGAVSPLNSGWYLLIPNKKVYEYFHQKALWRLLRDWDQRNGWGHALPPKTFYTRGKHKEITLWDFNGADMDQGLFLYFFSYFYGHLYLIDTELGEMYYYEKGLYSNEILSVQQQLQENPEVAEKIASQGADGATDLTEGAVVVNPNEPPRSLSQVRKTIPLKEGLAMCQGHLPTNYFVHFTGQSKPWIEEKKSDQQEKKKKNPNVIKWMQALDELQLEDVNSTNIFTKKFGAPMGFFNAGFPKGGYKID